MTNTTTQILVSDITMSFDGQRCCLTEFSEFVSRFEVPIVDGDEDETAYIGVVPVGTVIKCSCCHGNNVLGEDGTFTLVPESPAPFVTVPVEPLPPVEVTESCQGCGECECGKSWFPKTDSEWKELVSGIASPEPVYGDMGIFSEVRGLTFPAPEAEYAPVLFMA